MATKKVSEKTAEKKEAVKPKTPAKEASAKEKPTKKTAAKKETSKSSKSDSSASTSKNTEKPAKKTSGITTMDELFAKHEDSLVIPKQGDVVKGVIAQINKRSLVLDIGAKTEGVVADKELELAQEYVSQLEVGQTIDATVLSDEISQGRVLLSLKKAALDAKWGYFTQALEEETILDAEAIDTNKGGLIVVINGARGFVPSSQFGKELVGSYSTLVGQTVKVRAIEVDREKNRLIFSERHVSEAEEIAQKEEALEAVEENKIYPGVVSGVMHFGLFVTVEVPVEGSDTVGHVEGLVHISEISWEKVLHPKEYHSVGDKIEVRVLGVDEKTGKLNLSIKQLSDDPWVSIDERYQSGTTLTGTVSRVENFGVFVNVEPGVDGLIHSSKIDPTQTFERGEEITVHVENVDANQRRMSLSPVGAQLSSIEYR
ncbi:S1 RNA-binding domain-containing protein [Candidatus Woesebacteria bacterium]|nr:S1 RNA-binding domain-containing protein [Candidatus Woesebacteria bacterium]